MDIVESCEAVTLLRNWKSAGRLRWLCTAGSVHLCSQRVVRGTGHAFVWEHWQCSASSDGVQWPLTDP